MVLQKDKYMSLNLWSQCIISVDSPMLGSINDNYFFMIFSLWNIRGMGRINLWPDIGVVCKIGNIQLMALVETKSANPPKEKLWKSAGFDNMIYCPSMGAFWRSMYSLESIPTYI